MQEEKLEKNGTDMTGGVIFPLWGFPVALCVSKRIDSGVKSFLYVYLPPLWERGKNIFFWTGCALQTAG